MYQYVCLALYKNSIIFQMHMINMNRIYHGFHENQYVHTYLNTNGCIPRVFSPSRLMAYNTDRCVSKAVAECLLQRICDVPNINTPGGRLSKKSRKRLVLGFGNEVVWRTREFSRSYTTIFNPSFCLECSISDTRIEADVISLLFNAQLIDVIVNFSRNDKKKDKHKTHGEKC